MDGQKERQGDFVFTATETGEYRFCFNNQMSTFAEKFVDFEIAVCASSPLPWFQLLVGMVWVMIGCKGDGIEMDGYTGFGYAWLTNPLPGRERTTRRPNSLQTRHIT